MLDSFNLYLIKSQFSSNLSRLRCWASPSAPLPGGGVGWTPTRDAYGRVYLPDLYRYTSVKYSPSNQKKSAKNTV